MARPKLPFGQRYLTPEEVKEEMRQGGYTVPPEKDWLADEVVSGIGIYKTREGILCSWLIGISEEFGCR